MRWSIPYGPEKAHRWGPQTATLNWCEEDYYLTTYCAEIVNTITNVMFMLLGWRGVVDCFREGHDKVFVVAFLGYAFVGVGSSLYHTTLWYSMQLVDELSMIYTTCLMCWATFSYGHSGVMRFALAVFLLLLCVVITLTYHVLQDPVFHQCAYGILTATVLLRSWYLMETRLRETDPLAVTRMWALVRYGVTFFMLGFTVWSLDNSLCLGLRSLRRQIGMPWGMVLEGHGWWHLLTGWGAYYYIVYGIYLRHCLDGRRTEYHLEWSRAWSLPRAIRKKKQGVSESLGNGYVSRGSDGKKSQ